MGHGDQDPVVRYDWGARTAKVLGEMGYKVDFKTYKYVFSFLFSTWFYVSFWG